MAIDFSYDQKTDLAYFTLTGSFDLEVWLRSAQTDRFTPATFEIVDMRRCNLNTLGSMDLYKFTRYLRTAVALGRLIAGKTAILVAAEGPLIYNPAHRVFHNFFILAREHELPRDYQLFTFPNEAFKWLSIPNLATEHVRALPIGDGSAAAAGKA